MPEVLPKWLTLGKKLEEELTNSMLLVIVPQPLEKDLLLDLQD